MSARPNYQIFPLDLSAAGEQDIRGQFNYLHVVDAESAGAQALDALVSVQLGVANGPKIPLRLDGEIDTGTPINLLRVSWDAQPGVTVTLFLSMQDANAGVTVKSPPTKQLVTTSAGTQFTAAHVNVGAAAVQLTAADTFRQSVTLKALATNGATVWIGPDDTVTNADGIPLAAGESLTIDKNTGAVYAVGDASNPVVAVMVEK